MLNCAIQLANDAGRLLAEQFASGFQVMSKDHLDIVTEADLSSEQLIVERIKTLYPEHSVLAEESGAWNATCAEESEWRWIIDPLDGTVNYARRYPHFCVSLAVERAGTIIIGVVYDPLRDEMFVAERGGGTRLNGVPVKTSQVVHLEESMLCTGFPRELRTRAEIGQRFLNLAGSARTVRRDGAAALDLAYVACGRFDGFWEEGLCPWDVAAGGLLVEEAGGRVSSYGGADFDIGAPTILASNTLLHEKMMTALAL